MDRSGQLVYLVADKCRRFYHVALPVHDGRQDDSNYVEAGAACDSQCLIGGHSC